MTQKHDIDATLKAIRELMNRPQEGYEQEVLELTEDDLVDEEDKDAFLQDRFPKKEKNSEELNEILTQIAHSNNVDKYAESAARSIEVIKELVKKAESGSNKIYKQNRSQTTLDELVIELLKPILIEWIDNNLSQMIESILEREVRRIILEKDQKK